MLRGCPRPPHSRLDHNWLLLAIQNRETHIGGTESRGWIDWTVLFYLSSQSSQCRSVMERTHTAHQILKEHRDSSVWISLWLFGEDPESKSSQTIAPSQFSCRETSSTPRPKGWCLYMKLSPDQFTIGCTFSNPSQHPKHCMFTWF